MAGQSVLRLNGGSDVPLDLEEKGGFAFLLQATESIQTYARSPQRPSVSAGQRRTVPS
jgi:hypothetical protein